MNNCSEIDERDFEIMQCFCEDVDRYPARKTSQKVGERDKRCMALHKEAQWGRFGYSEYFCLGFCSDCLEPCSLYEDGILAGL